MSTHRLIDFDPVALGLALKTLEAEAAYSERMVATRDATEVTDAARWRDREFDRGRAAGIRLALRLLEQSVQGAIK